MPQYRIPFFGAVLVEAKTPADAEVSAGTWSRWMKQATHGVEMERPTRGEICALDLWMHQGPTDVTDSFAAYVEEDRAFRGNEACRLNYHVGVQLEWELFEWGERVKMGRNREGA